MLNYSIANFELLLKFRMLSRYRKLNGVMPLSAAEIEDKCFAIED